MKLLLLRFSLLSQPLTTLYPKFEKWELYLEYSVNYNEASEQAYCKLTASELMKPLSTN